MILTLVKINLRALTAGIFRRYKRKKKMNPVVIILIGLLLIYIAASLMFTVGAVFYGLCAPLFDAGVGWFYFALAGLFAFAICFIGSVFMVQSYIFAARDNELLLAMPIKPSAILAGRLSALLVTEYIFQAVIMVPVFCILLINSYISFVPALGIVFFFLAAALLPLIALALGCFVGWLVALITSRLRNKNVMTLVLSLGFLAAYFWLYNKLMDNLNVLVENGAEIAEAVRRTLFPVYHLGVAVANGSALSFVIFALCAIVPFIVMCALLSRSFVRLAAGGRAAKKAKYKEKALRVSGSRMALLKRELRYYWSQPMYILNSSFGMILMVVFAVVMIVRPVLFLGLFDQDSGGLAGIIDPGVMGAIVLSALALLNAVSAPTISLEGKNLWISKSLPVNASDILLSKAGLHLAVCGIPAIFAGLVCIVVLPISGFLQAALTLVLPISVTLMFSLLGVALNLSFPRFDWINPIQPVKQGISSMLTMFGGMALLSVLVILYIFLPGGSLSIESYLLICFGLFTAASGGLYAYLVNSGSRKFESL